MSAAPAEARYELTLIVSGASAISARAIADVRELCDVHLNGRHQLSVIDLREEAAAMVCGHVVAAPTLVRDAPLPVRRFVGDLSRTDEVLLALDIPAAGNAPRTLG
jgi:circadian clock protein KaiB